VSTTTQSYEFLVTNMATPILKVEYLLYGRAVDYVFDKFEEQGIDLDRAELQGDSLTSATHEAQEMFGRLANHWRAELRSESEGPYRDALMEAIGILEEIGESSE